MIYLSTLGSLALALTLHLASAVQDESRGSSFVMHEYWQCDPGQMEALEEASETIWAPFFDALVAEGMLLGWGNLTPVNATKYASSQDEGSEVPPDHQLFAWFESESAQANDAAWAEFDRRLRAQYPDNPRPWLYCDSLTVVTYGN